MKTQITKYISLFLLAVFLFPVVEKEIHTLEHLADAHCTSSNKHFHQIEHNCSICDFTITDSNATSSNNFYYTTVAKHIAYNPFHESVNTPIAFADIPARAPPTSPFIPLHKRGAIRSEA